MSEGNETASELSFSVPFGHTFDRLAQASAPAMHAIAETFERPVRTIVFRIFRTSDNTIGGIIAFNVPQGSTIIQMEVLFGGGPGDYVQLPNKGGIYIDKIALDESRVSLRFDPEGGQRVIRSF